MYEKSRRGCNPGTMSWRLCIYIVITLYRMNSAGVKWLWKILDRDMSPRLSTCTVNDRYRDRKGRGERGTYHATFCIYTRGRAHNSHINGNDVVAYGCMQKSRRPWENNNTRSSVWNVPRCCSTLNRVVVATIGTRDRPIIAGIERKIYYGKIDIKRRIKAYV